MKNKPNHTATKKLLSIHSDTFKVLEINYRLFPGVAVLTLKPTLAL